jgi:hypothetical protein
MANNITIQDDYVNSGDLALLQGAADELTAGDIVGTILKYKRVSGRKNTTTTLST